MTSISSSITKTSISSSILANSFGGSVSRQFLTLGGVNEDASSGAYTAVDGDVIKFKFTNSTAATQFFFDESAGLNRLFANLDATATSILVPAGVTVDIDGGGNVTTPDGKLHQVTLTIGAAAAGLVIDHYFSEFDATDFFSGVLADLEFIGSDNRFYPMKSGSLTTEPNALNPGVNDMTLNNLVSTDWEQFTQVGADWLGGELVTNGGFDTDTDWTKLGNWTISGGTANANEVTNTLLFQPATIGAATYREQVTVSGYVSGIVRFSMGGAGSDRTSDGTFTETRVANSDSFIRMEPSFSLGFVGSLDNVSVKRILEAP